MYHTISAIASSIILIGLIFTHVAPASLWLEVDSVFVDESIVGDQPTMKVERTIHRDFTGSYVVDVEKRNDNGFYTIVCSSFSSVNYNSDAKFPDPITLDWWTFPITCDLGEGTYRVETSWTVNPDWFPKKTISIVSNDFHISAYR